MDKYIILTFDDKYLSFNQTNNLPAPSDIINSNKEFHNQFIYTVKYFKRNDKTIIDIIVKNSFKRKINSIHIEDSKIIDMVLEFIKISNFKSLYIKNFKSLTISQCNLILQNKYINYINCYYIPKLYIQKFNKLGKKVNINYVDSFSDKFIKEQNLINDDNIYYKKELYINKNTSEKDIKTFLNINTFLKAIHLNYCDEKIIEKVIEYLIKDNRENIVIILYQDKSRFIENNFKYLKNLSKRYNKELNGEMKIIYSSKYIKNNIFKQLNYNFIKMISMIILYVAFVALLFTNFYSYITKLNIEKVNYQIYIDSLNEESSEYSSSQEIDKYSFTKSFLSLSKINSDIVGWLTVNNTKVNYPVVQADDNEYYLKRDFYKTRVSSGWIFMDYRNNPYLLDDNTIIYGHKLKSGLMFGTLSNVLKQSWFEDKDNQIITFDSISTNMKWQIFAIYKTSYKTPYLKTTFRTIDSFNEYIDFALEKSIYDFEVVPEYGDKILTLSTCIGNLSQHQRLVIHAKLIK